MSSLPNALTVTRIALVPLFVAAFFLPGDGGRWLVFVLFCLAGVTDAFDGMIARRLGAVTSFGRMLDPIADKLIVSAALLMLASDKTISGIHLVPRDPGLGPARVPCRSRGQHAGDAGGQSQDRGSGGGDRGADRLFRERT